MDLKNPTRTEALLANIAGHTDVPVPDMKNATRSERLLKEILDNGGGGGGDVTKEYVDTAIADAVADIDDDISALSDTVADKVDKENGKSLSTNDYTDADKALVQDSPITVTATGAEITASTAQGSLNALTVYGKSEVVDNAIKSAGEGWSSVRLADLTWTRFTGNPNFFYVVISNATTTAYPPRGICNKYSLKIAVSVTDKCFTFNGNQLRIRDDDYTTVSDFVASLGDATLCYQLADPTQGNCIAVKTDNGSGINGTMAVFSTGTPLYGVSTDIRDVMEWDGSSGEVTKVCTKVRLAYLTWNSMLDSTGLTYYYTKSNILDNRAPGTSTFICSKYKTVAPDRDALRQNNKAIASYNINNSQLAIRDDDYTTLSDFVASLGDAELVYELETPTTEQLTTAENTSIAGLRTYTPTTHAQNNAGATMTVEAYAGTANGQLISGMQPTRSPLLTLSANGWTNNTQTVTYEHDIGKRNTIDVEPASIKAWTAAGILATAETASTITFECDTVPTADLSFRVTSMEVR